MYTSMLTGAFKLIYTAAAYLPHAPRTGTVLGGECWRGLELSRKLFWSKNGLLSQEICAYYVRRWCVAVVPVVYSSLEYTTALI